MKHNNLLARVVVNTVRQLVSDSLKARHLIITTFAHAQTFDCCILWEWGLFCGYTASAVSFSNAWGGGNRRESHISPLPAYMGVLLSPSPTTLNPSTSISYTVKLSNLVSKACWSDAPTVTMNELVTVVCSRDTSTGL